MAPSELYLDLNQQKVQDMQLITRIIPNKESLKEKMIRSLRGWVLRFVVNVLIPFTGFAQV